MQYGADVNVEIPRLLFIDRFLSKMRHSVVVRARWSSRTIPLPTPSSRLPATCSTVPDSSSATSSPGELTYTVQPNATTMHQFSPLILQYEYMRDQTDAFKEILKQSPVPHRVDGRPVRAQDALYVHAPVALVIPQSHLLADHGQQGVQHPLPWLYGCGPQVERERQEHV